jgi:hypothetical protein
MSGTLAVWKTIPLDTAKDMMQASRVAKKVAAAQRTPGKAKPHARALPLSCPEGVDCRHGS